MTFPSRLSFALFLMVASFLLVRCNEDDYQAQPPSFTWSQIGLDGLKVNRLALIEDKLYAITSNGLYVMDVETESEFSSLGLKGKELTDVVVFNEDHLLASYRDTDREVAEIYETLDGGINWSSKKHNFGLQQTNESVTDFLWDAANGILYATSFGVLAKSIDKGTNWQPVWGDWGYIGTGMMVEINPRKPTDIWFGGQGGIENGYLVYLKNESVHDEWYDLVPNPTVPKAIVFDNSTPQNVYVGWEGELNRTSDSGDTWETLIDRHEEAHFFFGVGVSDNNPNLVFAGKWAKGKEEQPLTLYYSQDGGDTWKENTHTSENYGGIFDLELISTTGGERIFLALDKGGVYEVSVNTNEP